MILGLVIIATAGWAYSNWRTYAPTVYVQESTETDDSTNSDDSDESIATTTTASTTKNTTATTTTKIKTTTVNTKTGTTTPGAPSYTLAQIATHNDATSCYTAINGKVYDLTLWINMHPGGRDKILSICGIDGTARFMAQHNGAQKQMDILARFYIGTTKL